MKRFFLGLAANYTRKERLSHTFTVGRKKDLAELRDFLGKKYEGEAILCKNGRSALTIGLKAYLSHGDGIIVNGFTCYAVVEAIKRAGMKPIYADINLSDLNFDYKALEKLLQTEKSHKSSSTHIEPRGIIVQNTLGNPADILKIEKLAKKYNLIIIEDLAHSAGIKYPDGREAGSVGAATILSFGKDKSIDTISGGAAILRHPYKSVIEAPSKLPKPSDHLRARFYPVFGAMARGLTKVHLGGTLMKLLVTIHFVERSADNKLDLERRLSKFEARLALQQIQNFKKSGEGKLRDFYLVKNRGDVLQELKKAGFYFDGFWYEKPVSPMRYYKKVHFPEETCPNAVFASEHIVNLPTYYSKEAMKNAIKIIKKHLIMREGTHGSTV